MQTYWYSVFNSSDRWIHTNSNWKTQITRIWKGTHSRQTNRPPWWWMLCFQVPVEAVPIQINHHIFTASKQISITMNRKFESFQMYHLNSNQILHFLSNQRHHYNDRWIVNFQVLKNIVSILTKHLIFWAISALMMNS